MADTYFAGLRGTDDLVSNERAEHYRAGMLRLFPNGSLTLTALTNMMKQQKVTDPHFHWWTKTLTSQRATITGRYLDAILDSAYASGAVAGSTLYLKMSAADNALFRVGHQVLLRDASNYTVDCVGKVTGVVANGASSFIAVKLLEADDNGSGNDLSDCDTALIVGSVNSQGGTRPEAISQGPTEFENYTQIFRDSLEITRTLMETKLRTEDAYLEVKRDALEQHGIQMEKAFLHGVLSSNVGSNGKPELTTNGIIPYIKSYGTVEDYSLDAGTAYDGKTWLQAGDQWLDEHLEEMFRYGSDERLAFCGSGALLAIQRLVKSVGAYNISVREAAYGIKVMEWVTPFGVVYLKSHPLFSYEATTRNAMLVFEPANLVYSFITDTKFMPDTSYGNGGGTGKDGKDEEFLTECGLEMHFPQSCGYLNNLGVDNA